MFEKLKLMKILVTGGEGFLGKNIISQLLLNGCDSKNILILGNLKPAQKLLSTIDRNNVENENGKDRECCKLVVRGDIGIYSSIEIFFKNIDLVFHVAAKTGMYGDKKEFDRINILGTENVIKACKKFRVKKLVYTSSPSVVFNGQNQDYHLLNKTEPGPEYSHNFMGSHYASSKCEAEKLVLAANNNDNNQMMTIALRPHLIWGPGDPNLLPQLIVRAKNNNLIIIGDGKNKVSMTYIDNAAIGHLQAAENLCDRNSGKAYFINDREPVVLWEWIDQFLKKLNIIQYSSRSRCSIKKIPAGIAYSIGWLFEKITIPFNKSPWMTRFIAQQLSSTHTYNIEPAERDFGYCPVRNPQDAMSITIKYFISL